MKSMFGICAGLEKALESITTMAPLARPAASDRPTELVLPEHPPVTPATALLEQLLGPLTTPARVSRRKPTVGLPSAVLATGP